MNVERIKNIFKRWSGQMTFFSPTIALSDVLVSTVLRKRNGKIKHFINCYCYEKAKSIIYNRYKPVLNRWKNVKICDRNIEDTCNIYLFWWQGFDNAPKIVKECVKTIENHRGNHPVIYLSKDNWNEFCTIPGTTLNKLDKIGASKTLFSDVLRYNLLYQNGGIWIDPTCYVTSELEDEIYNFPFYTIRHGDDYTYPVAKGLWSTCKFNPLFGYVADIFTAYWDNESALAVYLLPDVFLALGYEHIAAFKDMIDKVPLNNQKRNLLRESLFKANGKGFDKILNEINDGTYINKITYKMEIDKFG